MAFYSSRSQKCFLEDSINVLPEDAFAFTAEQHLEYMRGQIEGKVIDFSTEPPSLIDRPPPSVEQLVAVERKWRDSQLTGSDRMVARHRDEIEEGAATTLTAEQYVELQAYRRALREWPSSEQFPDADYRPVRPTWLDQPTP